jgi:hypothetical protein
MGLRRRERVRFGRSTGAQLEPAATWKVMNRLDSYTPLHALVGG